MEFVTFIYIYIYSTKYVLFHICPPAPSSLPEIQDKDSSITCTGANLVTAAVPADLKNTTSTLKAEFVTNSKGVHPPYSCE